MKIGIDGLLLTIPFPCGTKNYAVQLLNSLAKIDKVNQYIIFSSKNIDIPKQNNFSLHKINSPSPILKRQLIMPRMAKEMGIDIFHNLESYGSVFNRNSKIITTVHDYDLAFTFPLLTDPLKRINNEFLRYFTFKNSRIFITNTLAIKQEIKKYIGKTKVFTIYEGVSKEFRRISKLYNNENYILTMADFAPRKNGFKTIKAFSKLNFKYHPKIQLKIVTTDEVAKNKFKKLIYKLGLKNRVDILENVSTQKLVSLYNNAKVFVYVSLYEGFGLPILEAMSCGCPVITSNRGAMKEVAKDAALLVNPELVDEVALAMSTTLENDSIRKILINKGLKRAKKFTWDQTAKETLNVYKYLYKMR